MILVAVGIILFIGLVVLHELGHFWVARRNGVVAEEFGIGFPPAIWRKKMKSGFDFTINLLPLGGFVKLKGEHDSDTTKGSFGAASDWAKTKIMLAGVAINFVTAIVLFTILALTGMPQIDLGEKQFVVASDAKTMREAKNAVMILDVAKDSPAAKAGLQTNDIVVSLRGNDGVSTEMKAVEDVSNFTKAHAGQPVEVVVKRGDKTETKQATLRSESEVAAAAKRGETIGYLGLGSGLKREQIGLVRSTWSAPIVGVGTTLQYSKLTLKGLGSALKGLGGIIAGGLTGNREARSNAQAEATSQVGGPLAIFFVLKEGANLGFRFVMFIIALISLTLAIMNVLPVPALDGGRLYLMLLSRLTKEKRLTPKMEETIVGWSFFGLLALIVLITIVDVKRFF